MMIWVARCDVFWVLDAKCLLGTRQFIWVRGATRLGTIDSVFGCDAQYFCVRGAIYMGAGRSLFWVRVSTMHFGRESDLERERVNRPLVTLLTLPLSCCSKKTQSSFLVNVETPLFFSCVFSCFFFLFSLFFLVTPVYYALWRVDLAR